MTVNGEKTDHIVITGDNGICVSISDTEYGNLRVTEIGQYIKNLHVIPQSGNSLVLTSSRDIY